VAPDALIKYLRGKSLSGKPLLCYNFREQLTLFLDSCVDGGS
jgi:hypothetical protein